LSSVSKKNFSSDVSSSSSSIITRFLPPNKHSQSQKTNKQTINKNKKESPRFLFQTSSGMGDSLQSGLAQYRNGTISFNQLSTNWLNSNSWHSRHKDWRTLYVWDRESKAQAAPESYTAEWVQ
jgi:hypothetical protein